MMRQRIDPEGALAACPIWVWIQSQDMHTILTSPPFWVAALWGLDLVMGSACALASRRWDWRIFFWSAVKLTIWLLALLVAAAFDCPGVTWGPLAAGCLRFIILAAEGTSVLRHLATLSKRLLGDDNTQAAALTAAADSAQHLASKFTR